MVAVAAYVESVDVENGEYVAYDGGCLASSKDSVNRPGGSTVLRLLR
jgi:hypothetical protein